MEQIVEIYKNLKLKNLNGEVWKDINGYEGIYQISNMGRVRSLRRIKKGWETNNRGFCTSSKIIEERILKQHFNKYLYARLFNDSKYKSHGVHRLVGQHFIPNPENKPEINHKWGIKTDNRATELEWSTPKQNMQHAVSIGLHKTHSLKGSENKCSKPVEKIDMNGKLIKTFVSATEAAASVGVCCSAIAACCTGRYKLIKGFKWIYKIKTK